MNYQQAIIEQIIKYSNKNTYQDGKKLQRQSKESLTDSETPHISKANISAIKVHHNNYIETGINALTITFPTLHGLLQKGDFRRLCHQYLLAYPKTCFDWSEYGQDMDGFILQIDAFSAQPFLTDVAKLDWQLFKIEKQKDIPVDHASFELMQSEEFSTLQFTAAPGLTVCESIFPLVELYQLVHEFSNQDDEDFENSAKESHLDQLNYLLDNAIKSKQARSIVLWREQYKGRISKCTEQAFHAFNSVIVGKSLEQVFSHFNDDDSALTNWLQTSIQNHQIIGVNKIN